MKKRITIGTLTLLSLMGMFGCKQQETVEALMTLDVKADYPEKEWVVQDFLDVEYIPLETNDEFITQGSVKAIGKRFVLVTNLLNDGNIFVFDRKTGKAVRKINRKGQGAEEYAFINGIILDEEKDEMFVNSAPDTVRNRKVFPFLCLQIIRFMGIPCKKYLSFKIPDLLLHLRNNGSCLLRAKCTVDEIILHVYYNENVLHVCHPLFHNLFLYDKFMILLLCILSRKMSR